MKVKIKQFDSSLPAPAYKTKGAACVDLYSRAEVTIAPRAVGYIPLNVALEIPEGYFSLLAARSSTHKLGLMTANGIGILDSDYRGDNDEYIYAAFNFTDNVVIVEKGIRVAQLLILKVDQIEFEFVTELGNIDRNGFGSTGKL